MNDQHTQGLLEYTPWTDMDGWVCGFNLSMNGSRFPLNEAEAGPDDDVEANARRLVACWNACDGISTETLELVPRFTEAGIKTVQSVEAERDALKAQLDAIQSGTTCSACATPLPGAPTGFERECVPCNRAVAGMARLYALMRRCLEDHHDLTYKDLQEVLGDYVAAPVDPVQRPGDCLPGGAL